MAREGRITGRVSEDGKSYELVQFDEVRVSIPIDEISEKMKRTISKHGWEAA